MTDREELRGDGIQQLDADGDAQSRNVAEQLSCYPQAFVNFECSIEV
jgi:hypothetical protein